MHIKRQIHLRMGINAFHLVLFFVLKCVNVGFYIWHHKYNTITQELKHNRITDYLTTDRWRSEKFKMGEGHKSIKRIRRISIAWQILFSFTERQSQNLLNALLENNQAVMTVKKLTSS